MPMITSRKHAAAPHVLAALAASLWSPLGAQAQQTQSGSDPAVLPTIQVKGARETSYKADTSANPKYTAPLLDTPQTIQVIPEQLMREQSATTLTEALRNSAGVSTFYFGENGSTSTGDAIYMRGYDASSSIFVDGVRDMGSISRDVFNIGQVEVVKGPAGSDAGRSSPTGYVNLITKKPSMVDATSANLSLGTASFRRATVDWNKALSEPGGAGTALRLNAVVQDSGIDGRDMVNNKRWAVAPSLAIGLGSPTRVYLDFMHMRQHNLPESGVPTIGLPGYTSPDTTRAYIGTAPRVDSSNFYGTASDFDHVSVDMATARVEHDVSGSIKLSNTARYGRTYENYMINSFMGSSANLKTPNPTDLSTWTLAHSNVNNKEQRNTILADQFNLSAKFRAVGASHSLNVGAEVTHEEQFSWSYYGVGATVYNTPGITNSGTWTVANLYDPNPYVTGYQRLRSGAIADGETTTVAAYLFDTLEFTPQWLLSGGLRMDHYNTNYFATTLVTSGATAGSYTPTALSLSGDLVTGKLGLVFKPLPNGSVYADYASGAQPPGGSNFALAAGGTGNSANRTDFKPQQTETYEVGTKWDLFGERLSLTGSLYRTEISNQVVQDSVSLLYYQTGKQRVQGVELGVVGQILKGWDVSANYTTMNTAILSGTTVTSDGANVLSYTPRAAFSAWTSYDTGFGLKLGLGANHNGDLHRGTDGAIGTPKQVDGYTVFNAMASYKLTRNVDLQLNVYNLFDKDYVAAINKSGYRYQPGAPRSGRLSATIQF